jgi:putative membrane protein
MSGRLLLCAAALVLAALWLGPLPALTSSSFAAHMTLHMTLVAVVAPMVAAGAAGTWLDAARLWPSAFLPVVASLVELTVVSVWHAPALHEWARSDAAMFWAEQTTFLVAGWLLWSAALGPGAVDGRGRSLAGAGALLFTSIHMTLVGALFALAPRALYSHVLHGGAADPIADQQLGGAIMILVGGLSYLVGGLVLCGIALASKGPGRRFA